MDARPVDNSAKASIKPAPSSPRGESLTTLQLDDTDSHNTGSFGMVYVNDVARHALLEEEKPQFPVGSIIIRAKLARAEDTQPQLLIALVKRERGFNPQANDWEFLKLNGGGSKIQSREKTGSCRDCHAQQKEKDFVFRSYLPAIVPSSTAPGVIQLIPNKPN